MSSPTDLEEGSISYPSVLFLVAVGFFVYRYFFNSSASTPSSASSTTRSSANTGPNLRFTPSQVDQVASMFPQLNRRDIMWDLQRNRGNVQATTERILMGGRLETAPASFQPTIPTTTAQSLFGTSSSLSTTSKAYVSKEPDLITRYNLQNRVDVSGKGKGKEEDPQGPNYGWASSKDERQAMLKRRRDEMILAARRKMQEKQGGRTDGAAEPVGGITS